jgi:peptidoglycan/xylan/chitin deacetylase (PgdA/CDA1 family)
MERIGGQWRVRSKAFAFGLLSVVLVACQPVGLSATSTITSDFEGSQFTPSPEIYPTATVAPSEIPLSEESSLLPPSGELVSSVDVSGQAIVAMTIDDGYGKVPFDVILDELRSRDIQATFFLIGLAAINLGEERLIQLAVDGHEIAYHSYSHDALEELTIWGKDQWLQDFDKWEETLLGLLGEERYLAVNRPYARAPYGLFNLAFLGMTEELGLVPVGWSNDPGDLNRGIKLKAGDIFLLHVRFPDAELLEGILDESSYEFESLSDLFAAQNSD